MQERAHCNDTVGLYTLVLYEPVRGEKTYDRGLLTNGVSHRDKRKVEVVQAYFALCLELVKEIK